jgi:hypothetical protein
LRNDLKTEGIEQTNEEIEALIKKVEPKVDMIFLETARQSESDTQQPILEHIG